MPTNNESNTSDRKNKILTRIVELEELRTLRLVEHEETNKALKERQKKQEALQLAFDEIKDELTKAAHETNRTKSKLDNITFLGKKDSSEIEQLKRELGRLTDVEANEQAYREEIDRLKELCLEASWRQENRTDGIGAFPHQIEGAIHLAVVKQGLLGDKRGLGKTLTNLIWLDLIESKKSIIVCPSDIMDNYIREIKLWTPHRRVVKLGKMPKGPREFLVNELKTQPTFCVVVNYEAWRKDSQLVEDLIALKADTLVMDEAHRAKTLSTVTCRGVTDIRFGANECSQCGSDNIYVDKRYADSERANYKSEAHRCRSCGHEGIITDFCSIKNVMPMTGTPILNKPQELYPHLRMIDVKTFPTQSAFLNDFCYNVGNRWIWGYKAEERLAKQIGNKYIARDRKSANVVIPPAAHIEHLITKNELKENYPQQYQAYEDMKEKFQLIFDPEKEYVMSVPYVIVQIMRLRQLLVWPADIKLELKDPKTDEILYTANLDIRESAKLDKAEELIKEAWDEEERVVLFSQFRAPLHELQKRLGDRAVVYEGGMTDYKRNAIQMDFDPKTAPTRPRWDAVLCNYKAGGEGLNLNAATRMVILDEEWNPGKQEQAYGRIDRIGTTRDTQIDTIRVENSIDTYMQSLIEQKRLVVEGFETQATNWQSMFDAMRDGRI